MSLPAQAPPPLILGLRITASSDFAVGPIQHRLGRKNRALGFRSTSRVEPVRRRLHVPHLLDRMVRTFSYCSARRPPDRPDDELRLAVLAVDRYRRVGTTSRDQPPTECIRRAAPALRLEMLAAPFASGKPSTTAVRAPAVRHHAHRRGKWIGFAGGPNHRQVVFL
jgi:hypothetical protein